VNEEEALLRWASGLAAESGSLAEKLSEVCARLYGCSERFDWVGFYFADEKNRVLHLGPFSGEPTAHTSIPYGHGICGQVAVSGKTYVSPDVAAEANYIACSLTVRSEIVVPVLIDGKFVAQLDIDSHTPDAFTEADRRFLEQLCGALAPCFR